MAEEFCGSDSELPSSHPRGPYSHEFLEDFNISILMKTSLYGVRPVKLKTKVLFKEIDDILDHRFQVEINQAKKSSTYHKKKKKKSLFSTYVYKRFLTRFNNNRVLAEKKLLTFLFSIQCMSEEYEYVDLFRDLIKDEFHPVEVNCFLLLRYVHSS
jgi:hypothetical protein